MKPRLQILIPLIPQMLRSAGLIILIGSLMPIFLSAQEIVFTASVNKTKVSTGGTIELTFTIKNADPQNFKPPALNDFHVLSGPNSSSNFQYINGKMSRSQSYSFILQPKKAGKFTIDAATVTVKGNALASNKITIEVVQGQSKGTGKSAKKDDIGNNVFLKLFVNKTDVYQGEQIVATYKIYTRLNIVNYGIDRLPANTGFWSQDIEMAKQIQLSDEVIDGVQYRVGTIKKVALFPQRSGKLEVNPLEMETVIRVQDNSRRRRSIFDDFFGRYQDIKRILKSNKVNVNVKPLPSQGRPSHFNGAVGKYNMEVVLDKTATVADDPITLRMKISGQGNIKLVEPPDIQLPPNFEVYDPKMSESISKKSNTVNGKKSYEYLIIPRLPGEYRLPPVYFSYFDPAKASYITLQSPEHKILVNKGDGTPVTSGNISGINKEDVELIGQDIRFIKTGPPGLLPLGYTLYGSTPFVLLFSLPFALFAALLFWLKRQERLEGNLALVKTRRANKVAKKRLSAAQKFLKNNNRKEFYDEIARAIWGYLGDKLNIQTAVLTKDHAREALQERQVEEAQISLLETTLNTCEMALFSPASDAGEMDKIYRDTIGLITGLEESIKQ